MRLRPGTSRSQGSSGTLDGPAQDQQIERWSERRARRGGGEDDGPEGEDSTTAQHVAELSAEDEQRDRLTRLALSTHCAFCDPTS